MKLKTWINKTKKKIKGADMYTIYYDFKGRNEWVHSGMIKRHPILLEADVVKVEQYETEYMAANFGGITGKGKCYQYVCWIDTDQALISLGRK